MTNKEAIEIKEEIIKKEGSIEGESWEEITLSTLDQGLGHFLRGEAGKGRLS